MGQIARAAADDAYANIGVVEDGENRGRWIETYQHAVGIPPGSPWCAAFVRYRLERAAARLGMSLPADFPDTGWVPSYVAWAQRNGRWRGVADVDADTVQPGDLACFWFEAKGRCAHIGIVHGRIDNAWLVVEGNTGPDRGTTVERDGDGVYLKRRSRTSLGRRGGFILLPW